MVVAEKYESNVGAPANQSLLEGVPSGRVLKGDISAGVDESASRNGVIEADCEVERGLAEWHVAAVKYGRDLIAKSFLSE